MKVFPAPIWRAPNDPLAATLVSDPVYLRPPRRQDHAAWSDLRGRSFSHLTPWEETWSAEALSEGHFRRRVKAWDRQMRRGAMAPRFVFRREDDALVGGVVLSQIRLGASQSAILGYWIGVDFIGRGYGGAAVAAVVGHGFDQLGLHRIVAACHPENHASRKLLEKLAFRHEGAARDYLRINGKWLDHEIYARLARD